MKLLTPTLLLASIASVGQIVKPGSIDTEIAKFHYLSNPETNWNNRTLIYKKDSLDENWNALRRDALFSLANPELAVGFNSAHPYGYNDGPVWRGKGFTNELNIGFYGNTGNFYYTFFPVLYHSQNSDFTLAQSRLNDISEYNYQFAVGGGIDYVQRYGNSSFIATKWGQSELRYIKGHFSVAASTANFTLGPATVNPIMMSFQGEGFPHLELGLTDFLPLKWKNTQLGKIKGSIYYGVLNESEYYDQNPDNENRFFTALSMSYVVPYVDWLRIGFNRVFYQDMEFFEPQDLTRSIFYFEPEDIVLDANGNTLNDRFDQMASIFVEWMIPKVDFRTYFEFAKNDFNGTTRNLLVDTEHSRAFTVGFDKVIHAKKGSMILTFEHTNLSRSISYQYRPEPAFYIHSQSRQGYTHNGQLLGAGIGPGSNSNYLSLTYIKPNSIFKIGSQRVQFNDDYFSSVLAVPLPPNYDAKDLRNPEYSFFGSLTKSKKNWRFTGELRLSHRFNEYYEFNNDKTNLAVLFSARRIFYKNN